MKKYKEIDNVTNKRIMFFGIIFFSCFLIIVLRISYMQLFNVKASINELNKLSVKTVYGDSMPRGKIYDRNYNVIVDNIGVKVVKYKKESNISTKDEVSLAYKLGEVLDVDFALLKEEELKTFWIINNSSLADSKITKEEYQKYKRRELNLDDLENLKKERITEKELSSYSDIDKEASYIYYLMTNGYYYDEKIIKEDVTEEEYAKIAQNLNDLKGVNLAVSWQRIYPYGDTLRQILGTVSNNGLPKELAKDYLNKGYSLTDKVGISYLEYQYEDELKGRKAEYQVKNGKKTLVKEGSSGNDIVLSIDINLQIELEKIIEEELLKAKKEANTSFYNHSSVIITNPNTGEILAFASKQITKTNDGYKISDYTTNILTGSNTPGSIVKGASMLVGYKTGVLKIGDSLYDKCIKFKNTPKKCSWKNLGVLNDITALKYSSNSYQFQLALKVAGVNYYYNMPLKIDSKALDTYKEVFSSVGLGEKSGIDLPNESLGYKGKTSDAGLLLNYSIGQYDTYTLLQLSSYVNTIINNGSRLKLNLVSEVRNATNNNTLGKVKYKYQPVVLNEVNIDDIYFERVKLGFKSVMEGYLGKGYMGNLKNTAGKTGTAETFYDSNLDGKIDKETYTKSFIGYAPYDNPTMSIVSISPHVAVKNDNNSYISNVNKRITSKICNKFFEIYK